LLIQKIGNHYTVFPVVKLSPTLPDPIPGRRPAPPPPPTLVDGEEEYEVEEILDSRMRYNCLEYLVELVMTRVTINGRYIHKYMQSRR
jgi:hypothetical protein